AEFDALYISSTSRRSGFHLPKSAIDDLQAKRVILPIGAQRTRAVMLSKIRGTDTGVIYPEPSVDADAADPGEKNVDPSKTIVRDIAAGKFAAMVTDISLQGAALDSVRKFAVGRLGALSMASYLQQDIADSIHHTDHIVRFSDLNTASFEKSNRIRPTLPGGLYSKGQAARSARRCFKCGTCTFCRKCYNYCPDLSIMMDAERRYREIDYDHCKGCGICAAECPRAAIDWVKE
ncbi:MAG: 4Fe-4S binding protein, partial [Desulfobacterales bacterium]